MEETIRIFLVDDHPVVREGLRYMLEREEDMAVVGEAGSAEEALTQVEWLHPEVILMDIKMPGMDGIELTRRLREKQPSCNIIILTFHEEYLAQAIEAGAVGYLHKDIRREELTRAIRAVRQGRSPLDLSLSRDLLTEIATPARNLSPRELEVLRLIAAGASNREIAEQLFLSETSVKRGVRLILEKLGVRNRSEAVAEAYRRKLI